MRKLIMSLEVIFLFCLGAIWAEANFEQLGLRKIRTSSPIPRQISAISGALGIRTEIFEKYLDKGKINKEEVLTIDEFNDMIKDLFNNKQFREEIQQSEDENLKKKVKNLLTFGISYSDYRDVFLGQVTEKKVIQNLTEYKVDSIDEAFRQILENIDDIKNIVLVTDIDDTLLPRGKFLGDPDLKLIPAILGLLHNNITIDFVSGHSRAINVKRLIEPLYRTYNFGGLYSRLSQVYLFANGGAMGIKFDDDGNEILMDEYNRNNAISNPNELKSIIEEVLLNDVIGWLDELANKYEVALEDIINGWKTFLKEDFQRRNFYTEDFDYSWLDGNRDFRLRELNADNVENNPQNITGKVSLPWFENRDEYAQISIKNLPKEVPVKEEMIDKISLVVGGKAYEFNRIRITIGTEIRDKFIKALKQKREDLEMRLGGFATVDITKKGVNKAIALKYIKSKIGDKKIIYFGDEFVGTGNDVPVLGLSDIIVVAVGRHFAPEGIQISSKPIWLKEGGVNATRYLLSALAGLQQFTIEEEENRFKIKIFYDYDDGTNFGSHSGVFNWDGKKTSFSLSSQEGIQEYPGGPAAATDYEEVAELRGKHYITYTYNIKEERLEVIVSPEFYDEIKAKFHSDEFKVGREYGSTYWVYYLKFIPGGGGD